MGHAGGAIGTVRSHATRLRHGRQPRRRVMKQSLALLKRKLAIACFRRSLCEYVCGYSWLP